MDSNTKCAAPGVLNKFSVMLFVMKPTKLEPLDSILYLVSYFVSLFLLSSQFFFGFLMIYLKKRMESITETEREERSKAQLC